MTLEFSHAEPESNFILRPGVVTFLDVLGWKGIWKKTSFDPISRLNQLIQAVNKRAKELRGLTYRDPDILVDDMPGTWDEAYGSVDDGFVGTVEPPKILSISDTIVLYSDGKHVSPLVQMHGELCKILICESIKLNIPVRGATACGALLVQEQIMVGPAVDEAASWHESVDWIGVIQTPSTLLLYNEESHDGIWKIASVPLKNGKKLETRCVNWPDTWMRMKERLGPERMLKERFVEMGPLDTEIAGKYINTLDFYRRITNLS